MTETAAAACIPRGAFAAMILGALGCGLQSAPAAAPEPARAAVTEAGVRRILSALAHDSMEGRFTGSRGADRAARFIASEMKSIGLQPAWDSGYLQKVPFKTHPQRGVALLESFAAFDTIPEANRRIGYNVIGVLPGADSGLRDDVVVIGAHYDHKGIGAAVNGDSIFNGADDDASGVTAVLSIARALAGGPRPKRTVVFMTTTGEEQGILGTQWYVRHPAFPLSRMVAELEIEMIGRPDSLAGGPGKAWLTGYDRSTMGEILRAADVPIVADPYPQFRFFERSDNIVFARLGIPAHTLSSYNLHKDYHTVDDEIEKVDLTHTTAVIHAAVRAARLLADGPAPQWKEGGRPPQR